MNYKTDEVILNCVCSIISILIVDMFFSTRIKDDILYFPPSFKDESPEERELVTDKVFLRISKFISIEN